MFESLKLSDNSKVNFFTGHKNTFGLNYGLPTNGGTCPGATVGKGGCCENKNGNKETCYVAGLCKRYINVPKNLQNNTDLVLNKTEQELHPILRNTVLKFLLNGGHKAQYFRLHWSGDFFNEAYAKAWVKVMREFPYVKFWAYTRSFEFIPILLEANNLALYLSIDPINKNEALILYEKYKDKKNLGLAYMGSDAIEGIKFIPCPELSKKVKNCGACKLCMTHTSNIKLRNIRFKIH